MPETKPRPIAEQLREEPLAECSEEMALSTIKQYFDRFNQKAFGAVAQLFDQQGQLTPPFGDSRVGLTEIEDYLNQKAQRMTAFPKETQVASETDRCQVTVVGQVSAIAFKVNVSWQFDISHAGKITQARIRLLASPGELLNMRAMA